MTLQNRLRQGAAISRERNINLDFAKIADEAADRVDALEAVVAERDALKAELEKIKSQEPFAFVTLLGIQLAQSNKDDVPLYLAAGAREEAKLPLRITKTRIGNYLRRHENGDNTVYRNGFKDGARFSIGEAK